jgi:hypothetical protein
MSSWDLYTTSPNAGTGIFGTAFTGTDVTVQASMPAASATAAASSSYNLSELPTLSTPLYPSSSTSSALVVQSPPAVYPNGTAMTTGRPGGNGTVANGTAGPSSVSVAGAMETARSWIGGTGILMALGGLVVAL